MLREQRLGSHAPNRQRSTASRTTKTTQTVPQLKTSALVALRADALTDRTTTYRSVSEGSDPSELSSEPDSWLP